MQTSVARVVLALLVIPLSLATVTLRAQVFDHDGEPGRHRESVSIVVTSPSGALVASVSGTLSGGNVQSKRIRH